MLTNANISPENPGTRYRAVVDTLSRRAGEGRGEGVPHSLHRGGRIATTAARISANNPPTPESQWPPTVMKPPLKMIEPEFTTEKQLEDAVASVAEQALRAITCNPIVLRGFGLDLSVFWTIDRESFCRFFEIKTFASHHGRCGFGNQRGEGNQIRLLFDAQRGEPRTDEELQTLQPLVRWILGDTSKPFGSARFVFFTCAHAKAAAMNGVRPGKQNNFRMSAFDNMWITWSQLMDELILFLRMPGEGVTRQ